MLLWSLRFVQEQVVLLQLELEQVLEYPMLEPQELEPQELVVELELELELELQKLELELNFLPCTYRDIFHGWSRHQYLFDDLLNNTNMRNSIIPQKMNLTLFSYLQQTTCGTQRILVAFFSRATDDRRR